MSKSIKGFTLVELIVSIALLALLVFGVASLFPRAVGLVQRSASLTAAASLAQAQLENLLAQDYQTLTVGIYEPRHVIAGALERQTIVSYLDPLTLAESPTDQGLKRAQVSVYSPSAFGQKTFSISTFIAKK